MEDKDYQVSTNTRPTTAKPTGLYNRLHTAKKLEAHKLLQSKGFRHDLQNANPRVCMSAYARPKKFTHFTRYS